MPKGIQSIKKIFFDDDCDVVDEGDVGEDRGFCGHTLVEERVVVLGKVYTPEIRVTRSSLPSFPASFHSRRDRC